MAVTIDLLLKKPLLHEHDVEDITGFYAGTVKDTILAGETVTIPEYYQQIVYDSLSVEGTLTVEGKLVIIPDDIIS